MSKSNKPTKTSQALLWKLEQECKRKDLLEARTLANAERYLRASIRSYGPNHIETIRNQGVVFELHLEQMQKAAAAKPVKLTPPLQEVIYDAARAQRCAARKIASQANPVQTTTARFLFTP